MWRRLDKYVIYGTLLFLPTRNGFSVKICMYYRQKGSLSVVRRSLEQLGNTYGNNNLFLVTRRSALNRCCKLLNRVHSVKHISMIYDDLRYDLILMFLNTTCYNIGITKKIIKTLLKYICLLTVFAFYK